MKFLKVLVFLCALLLFAAQAYALSITPSSGFLSNDDDFVFESRWQGTQTGTPQINNAISPILAEYGTSLTELYKSDVTLTGGSLESGALAASYSTTFSRTSRSDGWSGAIITYDGGAYVGPEAFLLVKDGNSNPAWILFDLTQLGWDGIDTLTLSGFWANANGAISNVRLFGNSTSAPVPEPATMLLLGVGLIGLAGFGRKRLRRK